MIRALTLTLAAGLFASPLLAQEGTAEGGDRPRLNRLRERRQLARDRRQDRRTRPGRPDAARPRGRRVHLRGVAQGGSLELFAIDLHLWPEGDGQTRPDGGAARPGRGRGVARIGDALYGVKVLQVEAQPASDEGGGFGSLSAVLTEMPERPRPQPVPMGAPEGDDEGEDAEMLDPATEEAAARPDLAEVGKLVLQTSTKPLGKRTIPVVTGEAGTPAGSFQLLARRAGSPGLRRGGRPGHGGGGDPGTVAPPMAPAGEDPADFVEEGF